MHLNHSFKNNQGLQMKTSFSTAGEHLQKVSLKEQSEGERQRQTKSDRQSQLSNGASAPQMGVTHPNTHSHAHRKATGDSKVSQNSALGCPQSSSQITLPFTVF